MVKIISEIASLSQQFPVIAALIGGSAISLIYARMLIPMFKCINRMSFAVLRVAVCQRRQAKALESLVAELKRQ